MSLTRRVQSALAQAGLALLKTSGAYGGYWRPWRGALFDAAERRGLHVTPVHFYSPIPDVGALPPAVWAPREAAPGIDLSIPSALALLAAFARDHGDEYRSFPREKLADRRRFTLANSGFGPGDAEIYFAMLRRFKPARVVEIGCGNSTLVASLALARNRAEAPHRACAYACIEPYLPDYLRPPPDGVTLVVEKGVQEAPLDIFDALQDGDFLFIDSTHVAALGSDVVHEFLTILPRLRPGVIVHVHDIFLPLDYPEKWAREQRFFWNEQYLLQAFLLHNADFETLLPAHALFALHRSAFDAAIPSASAAAGYAGVGPASFWMRKKPAAGAGSHSQ